MENFVKRIHSSYEYIHSVYNLPPTFKNGEKGKYHQIFPDSFTKEELIRKMDKVKKLENDRMNNKNK